jgi:hypothetical protein
MQRKNRHAMALRSKGMIWQALQAPGSTRKGDFFPPGTIHGNEGFQKEPGNPEFSRADASTVQQKLPDKPQTLSCANS